MKMNTTEIAVTVAVWLMGLLVGLFLGWALGEERAIERLCEVENIQQLAPEVCDADTLLPAR